MPVTNSEVQTNFLNQKPNRYYSQVRWRSNGDLYAEGNTLYSFSMPIALHLGAVEGKNGDTVPLILKNADRVSRCSNTHLYSLFRASRSGPSVSFSALMAAGIVGGGWSDEGQDSRAIAEGAPRRFPRPNMSEFAATVNIVDYTEDFRYRGYRHSDGAITEDAERLVPFVKPDAGMFILDTDEGYVGWGDWLVFGAVLLLANLQHYLCYRDESTYRVVALPHTVDTVEDAFDALKPDIVQLAELDGQKVVRQAGWYFLPTGNGDADIARMVGVSQTQLLRGVDALATMGPLPYANRNGQHACRWFQYGNTFYAKATVRHHDAEGKPTDQYKIARLGDEWHTCHRSVDLGDWVSPPGLARPD